MLHLRGTHRRGFMQIGSLGAAALALPSALPRALPRARANEIPSAAAPSHKRAVILFFMAGGPSHIDMYDMKPDAPVEVRGPFSPIDTRLSGLQVCELMPRHAQVAERLVVIRSITHDLSVHDDATHWVQTGYPLLNARQRGQQNPSQGAVFSALRGARSEGSPAYVCVPEDYRRHLGFYLGAAYLSSRHNALDSGGDPSLGNYRPPDFVLPSEVNLARLEDRQSLTRGLDRFRRHLDAERSYRAIDDVNREAINLVTSSRAREAFDLGREPDELKDRYGRNAYGQSALLARRLVESGVTFVNINLYEKDVDWWDDHYTIEKNLRKRLPVFDRAFATLIEDLSERGLDDQVLVGAFGEFGRAPRIDSYAGRGHWPRAMTAVLSGGGLRNGQIVGATTRDGGEPSDRPLHPADLLATIYHAAGIDHHQTLLDRQGRPVPVLPGGKPIAECL